MADFNPPQTRAEALQLWGPFYRFVCAYPIEREWLEKIGTLWECRRQCKHAPGYGPDDLFCWQHAQKVSGK